MTRTKSNPELSERAKRWIEENREAIESSNRWVEVHGLPLDEYRRELWAELWGEE